MIRCRVCTEPAATTLPGLGGGLCGPDVEHWSRAALEAPEGSDVRDVWAGWLARVKAVRELVGTPERLAALRAA